MNKKTLTVVFSLLITGSIIWLFLFQSENSQPDQPTPNRIHVQKNPETSQNHSESSSHLPVFDDEGVRKPEGMPDADWQRALRVHSIKKSANRKLNFYGKIVDQHGQPVDGVKLDIEILSYQSSFIDYLKTGREQIVTRFKMITEPDGMFSVEGENGTTLSIKGMAKDGYAERADRGVAYSFYYNNLSSGEQSNMYHTPDKFRPVVFQMWKKGEAEPLILTAAELMVDPSKGINEVYYIFSLDGKPSSTPVPGWDIKVTGKNVPSQDPYKQQDHYWEVTLTAGEGCGIISTESPYANLAPEAGYQTTLTFKSTDQKHPQEDVVRRAYFRGRNGEKYAAFRMNFGFGSRKTGERFQVKLPNIRINPNGSRNLEYDPSKRIK